MSLAQLLPQIQNLSRDDKITLLSLLEEQVVKDTGIKPNGNYPVWSPLNSDEAASVLQEALRTGKDTK